MLNILLAVETRNIGAEANSAKEGGGVSFEYATMWSFAPDEIMSFFYAKI